MSSYLVSGKSLRNHPSYVNLSWLSSSLNINPIFQELKYLHPSVHVHIISTLFERHPNLHADVSWDVLAKQIFMNYNATLRKDANHLHHDVHEDFDKEVKGSIVDTAQVVELRKELHEQFKVHEAMVKTHGSVTGINPMC